jgi:hypothetical protein
LCAVHEPPPSFYCPSFICLWCMPVELF